MKAIWIADGQVSDSVLNEACSSGCGSFIEGTAHSLRSNKYRFADAALLSKSPVDLGTKCTVFMSSRVKHAQKIGVDVEDIAAGVAYSVVRNALYRIIGADRVATMGSHVVVQGGTFMSDAVLRAFEKISGAEVVRPKQADLMGAIGAALVAYERAKGEEGAAAAAETAASGHSARLSKMFAGRAVAGGEAATAPVLDRVRSNLIGDKELLTIDPKRRVMKCPGCGNACTLSIVSFGTGRTYVSGNKCATGEHEGLKLACTALPQTHAVPHSGGDVTIPEGEAPGVSASATPKRRAGRNESRKRPPNVVALHRKLIDRYVDAPGCGSRGEVRIGLMNTLNMRAYTPFWHTLLHELGFSIVVADLGCEVSSAGRAWESVPSESVCYPAKISHARYYNMTGKDVDAIFMAQFERGSNCPVTSSYAQALSGNTSENPSTLTPIFSSYRPRLIAEDAGSLKTLLAVLNDATRLASGVDPIGEDELAQAISVALEAQDTHEHIVERATVKALDWLHADDARHALLVAGRPYHVDEAVMHDIDEELAKLGFAVLDMNGLPKTHRADVPKLPNDWPQNKRAMRAAAFAAADPQVDVVYLQSFGCLYDAMSIEDAHGFLAERGKQFISLKIDDINNIVHTRIRLRTLAEAIEAQKRKRREGAPVATGTDIPAATDAGTSGSRVAQHEGVAACEISADNKLAARESIVAEPMKETLHAGDLETARRDITRDICFSVTAMAARVAGYIKDNPQVTHVKLPRVCQSCMVDAVPRLVERATGRELHYVWADQWEGLENGAGCGLGCGVESSPDRSAEGRQRQGKGSDQESDNLADSQRPRIGLVGNPLIVFDPFMNDNIAQLIESLGCDPVFPDPDRLFVEDVRYRDQLECFRNQGITDVVYLQSFGCLKGHVSARGSLRSLKRDFPDITITVLDYDPEASALNRENRVRLVAEAAKERREQNKRQDSIDNAIS